MKMFLKMLSKSNYTYGIIKGFLMYEAIILFHERASTYGCYFQRFNISMFQRLIVLRCREGGQCFCGTEDVWVLGILSNLSVAEDDVA